MRAKKYLSLLCMLIFGVHAMGQFNDMLGTHDPKIVKKYIYDTTGFTAYPDGFLLEHIKPAIACKQLEINTCWANYKVRGQKVPSIGYRNLYRYPAPAQKIPDSVVLSYVDLSKTFASCFCPNLEPWYISAQTKNGQIITVNDIASMKAFLGKIDNIYNACLWLYLEDETLGEPTNTSHYMKYKKVKNGFLIENSTRISNAHVTTADLTYYISKNFHVTLISTRHISAPSPYSI